MGSKPSLGTGLLTQRNQPSLHFASGNLIYRPKKKVYLQQGESENMRIFKVAQNDIRNLIRNLTTCFHQKKSM